MNCHVRAQKQTLKLLDDFSCFVKNEKQYMYEQFAPNFFNIGRERNTMNKSDLIQKATRINDIAHNEKKI